MSDPPLLPVAVNPDEVALTVPFEVQVSPMEVRLSV
jgi:hypothetical protein